MTIAESTPKQIYNGDGANETFTFSHKTWAKTDLVVKHKTAADVETTLVLDTDYTVNAVYPATGQGLTAITVTFPKVGSSYSKLAGGPTPEQLMIKRVRSKQRTPDINGAHQFNTLNLDGDDMVGMVQEIIETISRMAQFSDFNTDTPPTLEYLLETVTADMLQSVYDPTAVHDDAFNHANMHSGADTFGFIIDGAGVIVAGKQNYLADMERAGTITNIKIRSIVAGVKTAKSISCDMLKNGVKISASDPIDLVGSAEAEHSSFTGWTAGSLDFLLGDEYGVEVTGVPDAEYVIITVYYSYDGA
ncbi:MAG: hypothetical protein ACYS1A_18785 [Planctomycetota bacterium]|jgi:hypothetical protein